MERYKIYSPLTDKELVQKAYWWIEELIKSGGNAFVMHVPAQLDHDTDLVFFNLSKRFDNLLGKYEALQAKCERYEKALNEIAAPNLYTPDTWDVIAHNMISIANEALSGEGEKDRNNIATICHALAEEVAKDADTAEAYLKKEGVDVAKIKENAKFIAWLAELAALLRGAAQGQPIKINQEEARKWYDDGMTAYQCFRETWNME